MGNMQNIVYGRPLLVITTAFLQRRKMRREGPPPANLTELRQWYIFSTMVGVVHKLHSACFPLNPLANMFLKY